MTMPSSRPRSPASPPVPIPAPRPRRVAPRSRPAPGLRSGSGAAFAFVLAATVIWGFSGVATRGVLGAGIGAFEIAFWRLLLGGLLFALHAGARRDLALRSRADAGRIAIFALVAFTLYYGGYNVAIERGGVSLVNLFIASVPVLVALTAWAILGERFTPRKAALGVLSAAGLVLVVRGGGPGVDANAVSVGAALTVVVAAVAYAVLGKDLLRRYSPLTLNAFAMPLGALVLLPLVRFETKTPLAWSLLVVLAVASTYAAHLCYQSGLKRTEASRVALLTNVEAVTALAAAALLFGERFTPLGLAGVVLILAAAALVALPRPPDLAASGRRAGTANGKGGDHRGERCGMAARCTGSNSRTTAANPHDATGSAESAPSAQQSLGIALVASAPQEPCKSFERTRRLHSPANLP